MLCQTGDLIASLKQACIASGGRWGEILKLIVMTGTVYE